MKLTDAQRRHKKKLKAIRELRKELKDIIRNAQEGLALLNKFDPNGVSDDTWIDSLEIAGAIGPLEKLGGLAWFDVNIITRATTDELTETIPPEKRSVMSTDTLAKLINRGIVG